MSQLKHCFFLVWVFCFSASVNAATIKPNAFQVEVIAFLPHNSSTITNHAIYPAKPSTGKAQTLLTYSEPLEPYMQLPTSQLLLTKEAQKIASHYPLLFHLAWIQRNDQRQPVKIERPDVMGLPLIGTIQVTQGYYYYLTNNLLLGEHIAIQSKQKLRKDELHYIDNPTIGLLVTIHPLLAD